jgi:hypothetical protein
LIYQSICPSIHLEWGTPKDLIKEHNKGLFKLNFGFFAQLYIFVNYGIELYIKENKSLKVSSQPILKFVKSAFFKIELMYNFQFICCKNVALLVQ